jgi:hypothetical protein
MVRLRAGRNARFVPLVPARPDPRKAAASQTTAVIDPCSIVDRTWTAQASEECWLDFATTGGARATRRPYRKPENTEQLAQISLVSGYVAVRTSNE